MRAIPLVIVSLLALSMEACGDTQRDEPAHAVTHAARATFDRSPRSLSLGVRSPDAQWHGRGRIEFARGRFRLLAKARPGVLIGSRREIVVGTSGEGIESTFQVLPRGFGDPGGGTRCWFNPHSPVGSSHDTLSVEEGVRAVGAIIESLGHEIDRAATNGGETYAVRLDPSATRPRDEFHQTDRRVWGDRELLTRLAGPIRVTVGAGGGIESLSFRLRSYRPSVQFQRPPSLPVALRATLGRSHHPVRLRPPGCLAIE